MPFYWLILSSLKLIFLLKWFFPFSHFLSSNFPFESFFPLTFPWFSQKIFKMFKQDHRPKDQFPTHKAMKCNIKDSLISLGGLSCKTFNITPPLLGKLALITFSWPKLAIMSPWSWPKVRTNFPPDFLALHHMWVSPSRRFNASHQLLSQPAPAGGDVKQIYVYFPSSCPSCQDSRVLIQVES